jgi:hypothetical protein
VTAAAASKPPVATAATTNKCGTLLQSLDSPAVHFPNAHGAQTKTVLGQFNRHAGAGASPGVPMLFGDILGRNGIAVTPCGFGTVTDV